MTFVDMEITRQGFAARYANVGRAMLGMLAEIYGIDIDIAEHWADQIDREHQRTSAALYPKASRCGAEPSGAVCTTVPDFSHSYPVGLRRGSGAAATPLAAAPVPNPKP